MCAECLPDYAQHLATCTTGSTGCPACRSTQGILIITTDAEQLNVVSLRLDGSLMKLQLSSRAMRQVEKHCNETARSCKAFEGLNNPTTGIFLAFVNANVLAVRETTKNFLEQEAMINPALKKLYQRGRMIMWENNMLAILVDSRYS